MKCITIKSEADLPKENREFFVKVNNDYKSVGIFSDGKFWADDKPLNVTSYLDETPSESEAVEESLITEYDMTWVLRLKEYFEDNNSTQFKHLAYHFLENFFNKINQSNYKLVKK